MTNLPTGIKDPPDYTDLQQATSNLSRLTQKLAGMSKDVANAKMVKEYDSERRKAALSRAVMRAFKAGCDSASKAEHMARDDERYNADLKIIRENYSAAEDVLTDFQITIIQIESTRSEVSAQKAIYGSD